MNTQETAKIVTVIKSAYPNYYRKYTDEETATMIQLWQAVLEDIPYSEVNKAFVAYLQSGDCDYPPNAGQLRKIVFDKYKAEHGTQTMTAMQAWDIVRPRLSKTAWDDENIQFNTLPPLIQQAIGSASTMRSWGQLPSDTVGTVIMSQFVKSYNALAERHEKEQLQDYSKLIGSSEHRELLEELKQLS